MTSHVNITALWCDITLLLSPTAPPSLTLSPPSFNGVYNVDVGRQFQLSCHSDVFSRVTSYRVLDNGMLVEIESLFPFECITSLYVVACVCLHM